MPQLPTRIIRQFLYTSLLLLLVSSIWMTWTDDMTSMVVFGVGLVTALPDGAPVCSVGEAAPQVLHLDPSRNPRLGDLESGAFYVQIGDTRLDSSLPTYNFDANEDLTVLVTSDDGTQFFKGVLLVLSRIGSDMTGNLFLKNETQLQFLKQSIVCEAGRVAVTHFNADFKNAVTATMNFDENYDIVYLDVNIVVLNNELASVFYYNQYKLRITGATGAPTAVPVVRCGLFRLSFFCLPRITFCGFLGRLFGQDQSPCIRNNQFLSILY